jgi:predicted oxidoreductase
MLAAVDASLRRLGVEVIDLLMLHRPDYLMDPEEVADTFAVLRDAGKVREFGVSNFKPSQVSLLQHACPMPLAVNQIELSLANLTCLDDGTLDQCLAEDITPLAWSPLAGGKLGGGAGAVLPSQQNYRVEAINAALDAIAKERGTSRPAVALAWLQKHPAGIIPIIGSTSPENIRAAAASAELELTREEWYRLLETARGSRLP